MTSLRRALGLACLLALPLLHGVAVAQVSPNPQSGVPTATGTIQGVADFVWNGTAWVAATQAGATLPTGAATSANQAAPTAAGTSASTAEPIQGVTGGVPVAVASPIGVSSLTPTVQAAAYASGNSIGGLLSFTGVARIAAGSGLIQSAVLSFTSGVVPATDLILFNANPTASTITDKTAIAVNAADVGKLIAVIHISDCVLGGASAPSLCQAQQQAVPFLLPSGTTVYGALVARAAATLTSTTDVTIALRTLQN